MLRAAGHRPRSRHPAPGAVGQRLGGRASRTTRSTRSSGAAGCRPHRCSTSPAASGITAKLHPERRGHSGAAVGVRAAAVPAARHPEGLVSRPARPTWRRRRRERARRRRLDGRAAGLRPDADAVRQAGRAGGDSPRGAPPGARRRACTGRRRPSIPAPSATTRNAACGNRSAGHRRRPEDLEAESPATRSCAAPSGGLATVLAIGPLALRALLGRRDRAAVRLPRHVPAAHARPELSVLSAPARGIEPASRGWTGC